MVVGLCSRARRAGLADAPLVRGGVFGAVVGSSVGRDGAGAADREEIGGGGGGMRIG